MRHSTILVLPLLVLTAIASPTANQLEVRDDYLKANSRAALDLLSGIINTAGAAQQRFRQMQEAYPTSNLNSMWGNSAGVLGTMMQNAANIKGQIWEYCAQLPGGNCNP